MLQRHSLVKVGLLEFESGVVLHRDNGLKCFTLEALCELASAKIKQPDLAISTENGQSCTTVGELECQGKSLLLNQLKVVCLSEVIEFNATIVRKLVGVRVPDLNCALLVGGSNQVERGIELD